MVLPLYAGTLSARTFGQIGASVKGAVRRYCGHYPAWRSAHEPDQDVRATLRLADRFGQLAAGARTASVTPRSDRASRQPPKPTGLLRNLSRPPLPTSDHPAPALDQTAIAGTCRPSEEAAHRDSEEGSVRHDGEAGVALLPEGRRLRHAPWEPVSVPGTRKLTIMKRMGGTGQKKAPPVPGACDHQTIRPVVYPDTANNLTRAENSQAKGGGK